MHGINLPIFSLRADQSSGIGEYLDLLPVIDWVKEVGMDVIQILPINDQGDDPSPYNALSACALNPLLIKIEGLSENVSSQRIDYASVKKTKEKIPRIKKTPAFHDFVAKFPWTFTYAKFKALKKKNHNIYWPHWEHLDVNEDEITIYLEQQYLAYLQMKQVREYADQKNIKLMGDVPILISPDSADVWAHPEWFNRELSVGAPPDIYSEKGQKWGFPLYRWDEMEKSDFQWWKERLRYANEFFHYYRLDHIIGFYRLWACSHDKQPIEGSYYPPNKEEWVPQGEKLLKMMLECVPMKPIGEDLGSVPEEVRHSMKTLNIPGTKVIRWEREWRDKTAFIPYDKYPHQSLTTVSTHDAEPLRLWWQEQPKEAREFALFKRWVPTRNLTENMIREILKDSHHTASEIHINLLQEYFSLCPELRYKNPVDDRINTPGIISPSNWSYLFKPTISEWTSNKKLKDEIQNIIR